MAERKEVSHDVSGEAAEPEWFRAPTRREHRLAAGLFAGFAAGFVALFFVLQGWWFRWVILGLGVYSLLYAALHLRDVRGAPPTPQVPPGVPPPAGRSEDGGGEHYRSQG